MHALFTCVCLRPFSGGLRIIKEKAMRAKDTMLSTALTANLQDPTFDFLPTRMFPDGPGVPRLFPVALSI
jgi:hypothetical protein